MKNYKSIKKNIIKENGISISDFENSINKRSSTNYNIFPKTRLRRLRKNEAIRDLLQETHLSIKDLVVPLFVQEGINNKIEIESMPGIFRFPVDKILEEVKEIVSLGIRAIILFGIPLEKNEYGNNSFYQNGIVQQAIGKIKAAFGDKLAVISDVCLCQYTSHGHCGIVNNNEIDNDETLKTLAKVALSHAKAGADIVAPSAMMDGQVKILRDFWMKINIMRHLLWGIQQNKHHRFFLHFEMQHILYPFLEIDSLIKCLTQIQGKHIEK